MIHTEGFELSSNISKAFEWERWANEIPEISFPNDWKVKIIPPFACAIVRFRVRLPGMPKGDSVSVYLDCYDILGCYSEPYWEVYPCRGGVGRCSMNDTDELLRMISDRSENDN